MQFSEGVGQLSTTVSWVVEVFLEQIMLLFGQNKYNKILNNFLSQNKGFYLPKITKKYSFQ